MFDSCCLMNFRIYVCRLVVICSGIITWSFKKANPFLNPIFSIWFEFPVSITCVEENTTILLVFLSIKEYVKYFVLWLGLSDQPSPHDELRYFFLPPLILCETALYNFRLLFLVENDFEKYLVFLIHCIPAKSKKRASLW